MFLLMMGALALLQAGTEPAAPTSPISAIAVAQPPALKPGERKVKMVCRDEVKPNSRFSKRVCLTQEDFARREEDARSGLAEIQRFSPVPPTQGGR